MKLRVVCFDLDGTLADCTARRHKLPDWKAFFDGMADDPVVPEVKELIHICDNAGYSIVLCSGRPEEYRDVTIAWLTQHTVSWDYLFMRPTGDHRADHIVKTEMLEQMIHREFEIQFVVDDRSSVIEKCWRRNGIFCFQVMDHDWDHPDFIGKPGKLTVLIGPSCSGKSTYAAKTFPAIQIISSDALRAELCGDFRDQTKNDAVFTALRGIAKARLISGLPVVIDATNLRDRDRKDILEMAPKGTEIDYVVIDRPLKEKEETAGWRADVVIKGKGGSPDTTLIRRHAEIFKANLKAILRGDDDSRVVVIDLRGSL